LKGTKNIDDLEKAYTNTLVDISEHQLIKGRVVGMNDRDVLIDIGFKSEGIIDRSEFTEESLPSIGDQVEVYLEYLEDSSGNTILSKEKADFMLRWRSLRKAYDNEEIITGKIIRRIKGGMIVDLGTVQAFLPGSQLDVRPITDFDIYVDKDIDLRIVKLNESRKNIVVSHKLILQESLIEQREALFKEIEIGTIMEGRVKNITDFGVFVDLGGIDGLLHITDLSTKTPQTVIFFTLPSIIVPISISLNNASLCSIRLSCKISLCDTTIFFLDSLSLTILRSISLST
jgi:small subunit ribosomal protein S1